MHTDERLRAWREQGFFSIPGWLTPAERLQLADACDHALLRARAESTSAGHFTTHLSNVLVPEYFLDRPDALASLAEFVRSPPVLGLVCDLGRPLEGELQLRGAQYFHEPTARDHDGVWHRDGDEATPIVPRSGPRPTLVRFRLAFAPDDHLEYVPGSQARPDTELELRVRRGPVRNGPLPAAAQRIVLEPGDLCVFDPWGIHRGRYRRGRARRTLDLLFGFGPRVLDAGIRRILAQLKL